MATKHGLIITTEKSRIDLTGYHSVTKIKIDETIPEGTSIRYLVRFNGGTWKKYDVDTAFWKDADAQSLTPASVASEGNTGEELMNASEEALAMLPGLSVGFAAAISSDSDNIPQVNSITFSGVKNHAGDYIMDGSVKWKVEDIDSMVTAVESDDALVTLTRVDNSKEQFPIVQPFDKNITWTVTGTKKGDFDKLSDALNAAMKYRPAKNGITLTIKLLSGYKLNERIVIENRDLRYVTVTAEDSETLCTVTDDTCDQWGTIVFQYNTYAPELYNVHFKAQTAGKGSIRYVMNSKGFLDHVSWNNGCQGISIDQNSVVTMHYSDFNNNTGRAVVMSNASVLFALNCNFNNNGATAVDINTLSSASFIGCNANSNKGLGFSSQSGSILECANCHADSNAGNGYSAVNASQMSCVSCFATSNTASGFTAHASRLQVLSCEAKSNGHNYWIGQGSNATIEDSSSLSTTGWGLLVQLGASANVDGCNLSSGNTGVVGHGLLTIHGSTANFNQAVNTITANGLILG